MKELFLSRGYKYSTYKRYNDNQYMSMYFWLRKNVGNKDENWSWYAYDATLLTVFKNEEDAVIFSLTFNESE